MVEEKIIAMLAEAAGTDAAEINADSKFADLGFDSLDLAEMKFDLEDEFNISLELSPELDSVGKLTAAVEAAMGK